MYNSSCYYKELSLQCTQTIFFLISVNSFYQYLSRLLSFKMKNLNWKLYYVPYVLRTTNLVKQVRVHYILQRKHSGQVFGHQLLKKTQMKSQHMRKTYVAVHPLPSWVKMFVQGLCSLWKLVSISWLEQECCSNSLLPHILMSKIQKEKNKRRAYMKNAVKRQRLPNQQQAKQYYTVLVKSIRTFKGEQLRFSFSSPHLKVNSCISAFLLHIYIFFTSQLWSYSSLLSKSTKTTTT